MIYYVFPDGGRMPMIGLGTYGLRGEDGARCVLEALDMGYRHLDTAATYENEREVGRGMALSQVSREEIFLTTKVDREDLCYDRFIASCESSLERLNTDYVDLLLVHWPNREVPIEETLRAAQRLVEQGKARRFGVSNFIRPYLEEAVGADRLPIATNQVEYHPYLNQKGLLRYCLEKRILLTAYSPLGHGKGHVLNDPVLQEISQRIGRTVAQVALRWLLQKGIAVIPKSASRSRMAENLAAADFELEEGLAQRIEALEERKRLIDWWPGDFEKDPGAFE
ncbi:aldo/keto reductase [Pelagicoccus sp. SDUM812003]|uniref:aldo/keto reductase n=1 Tax=Pelagicoccus sp. SDUM812003 TaxID=3041267 RepID=UPI00281038ED|nr:aldo/keto reductase [Pelagicoccus sp. SDUM812003]MDQ8203765.1 aldo/keto reductase [Pelagicoccus sp. SDUM812003]